MCGIAGIISHSVEYRHVALLESILMHLKHRGPDASHITLFQDYGAFGHNRLTIIDVHQRSHQPMWDKTNRFCITFNGEIYNFQLLKKELQQRGHMFSTESDTEVLVEAWAEWGVRAIDKLVGMFAFAVWDKQQQQLFLVRDRMGEKPLYFAYIQNNPELGIVFASELKGLKHYPYIKTEMDSNAINHYLSFNYTSTSHCIFQSIYKLPPASYLFFDCHHPKPVIQPYWHLENYFHRKNNLSLGDAIESLQQLLTQSVQQQSIADVPLGAFLSGGLDSSTIVYYLKNSHTNVNTFSMGFYEKSYNELNNSDRVSAQLATQHHTNMILAPSLDELATMVCAFDEPFADTSLIPTFKLSEFSREKVKVSLSGDGGDELFGGYITYQADRYHRYLQHLPKAIKRLMIASTRALPTSFRKISFDYKIKHFLSGLSLDLPHAHASWREIFSDSQKEKLWPESKSLVSPHEITAAWFGNVSTCHYLDQAMYADMKTWLVDDILVKVDQASMAHSLEVRAPFLDHRIVEFAASLPIHFKQQKQILKKSQKAHLSSAIRHQSKKGFNSPVSHWINQEWREFIHDTLTNSTMCTLFCKKHIETLLLEHQNRVCDNGNLIFNLLCFALWLQG